MRRFIAVIISAVMLVMMNGSTVLASERAYRCRYCGDTFFRDFEDKNHHSMNHNY